MRKYALILMMATTMTACGPKAGKIFSEDWNTPYGTAPFSQITEADYMPAILAGIEAQKAEIRAIVDNPDAPTFENTIAAYELSGDLLSKVSGVFFNLSESDSTPTIQQIEEEVTPIITEASDAIFMDEGFFARVKAVYENMDGLDREQQMVTKKLYERFVRNGVGLDAEKKARFAEINSRLAVLSQKFGQNLLAENNAFRDAIGVTVSAYPTFMATCEDRALREKAFKAYSSRCNNGGEHDNNALVLEIMKLRTEKANLLGYKTSAEYLLADKMAGNPETVDAFLQPIMDASMRKAKEEIADMEAVAGHKIEPWDWFYYAEKVRALKYDLDESVTGPYFTADSVSKGVFAAAEKVYGIHIEPAPEVEVYNDVTKAYKLTDADGSLLGIFYQDWFSRDTKRGGAWMNNFREQYVKDGVDVRPIIVNQFNENWAFVPEILAVYAKDYRTGEPIPAELVEKIGRSLKFNQGFTTGELCAASILDMKWHELTAEELAQFTDAQSIRDFETKVCGEMGLIDEIIPRYRTTYFNHIFNSGYSAGYYSYLWSEVLDVDAWEKFVADGVFNPATAKAFRQTFLEKGGSEEPMTLYHAFRGADPDPSALLRARGLE